jgi:hypothetical protein
VSVWSGRVALRHPGLRLPRHRATTAHLGAIYPFQAQAGSCGRGVYLGVDLHAGYGAFCFEPFTAYGDGVLTATNLLVLGEIGAGKSSAVKTFLYRAAGTVLGPNGRPRFVAVLDPKGEYGPLAAALGLQTVRLHPGGTDRLNPLAPAPGITDPDELAARRATVAIALAGATLGRDLTAVEEAGVGWATTAVTSRAGASPTLADLVTALAAPTTAMAAAAGMTVDELARGVIDVRFGLSKLLDRQLRGMLDGAATVELDRHGRGLVVDLSALYHDHDALNVVMIAVTAWLQALLANPAAAAERLQAYQVWDECWALTGRLQSARYMQASQKLARAYGITNIAVTHRISDLRAQHDDGTAAAKVTEGLLADSQVRILFRQPPDQVAEATRALGLTSIEADWLPHLPRGRALWKLPHRSTFVDHVIGPGERRICDTDERLEL